MTTQDQRGRFGDRVRQLRDARGWSQAALAKRLNVTDATVAKWERGGGASEANVIALEDVFAQQRGALGSILGQAPPLAMHSPEVAIAADADLPPTHQRLLLALLAEMRRLNAEEE